MQKGYILKVTTCKLQKGDYLRDLYTHFLFILSTIVVKPQETLASNKSPTKKLLKLQHLIVIKELV